MRPPGDSATECLKAVEATSVLPNGKPGSSPVYQLHSLKLHDLLCQPLGATFLVGQILTMAVKRIGEVGQGTWEVSGDEQRITPW